MSRIDELIKQYCPDGVEFKTLGVISKISNGRDHKHLAEGKFAVYGSGGIMRHASAYIYDEPSVLIPRKGSIGNIFYVDQPFWTVDTIFYTKIKRDFIIPKFFYYLMKNIDLTEFNFAGGVPSLTKTILDRIILPVPPLPVQEEIVRILDKFTALEAELEAELEARKKQYEYYRDQLLTFGDEVEWKALGEACFYVDYRGKTPKKTDSGVFLVTAKNIRRGYIDYEVSKEFIQENDYAEVMRRGTPIIGDVLITTEAPCGFVAQVDRQNIALAQRVIKYRTKSDNLSNSFLKHYLLGKQFQNKLGHTATGSTVKGIKGSKLHRLTIPVPPLTEQARIVAILDKFDALVNDISVGLPAELEARRKQYEHYRDQLLTFQPLTQEA